MQNGTLFVSQPNNNDQRRRLVAKLKACPPQRAATLLVNAQPSVAFEALTDLNPSFTQDILRALPDQRRQAIITCATPVSCPHCPQAVSQSPAPIFLAFFRVWHRKIAPDLRISTDFSKPPVSIFPIFTAQASFSRTVVLPS